MSKVYFSKNLDSILDKIDINQLGENVAIKVHFGEKGCTTFIKPKIVEKIYNKIIATVKKAALVECNVLYKGSRTNRTDHIKTAREHGFNLPIDILDGENGEEYIEVDGCKIGRGLKKYDSMLVLSHFKGHGGTGFGGAIKNVGMGLGSRAGKLDMHSAVKPSILPEMCIGCGVCAEHCEAQAIAMINNKAVIDQSKCVGCAICIAYCQSKAIAIPWEGRSAAGLQKRIAEYAVAVLKIIPNTIYINILENITENCDCLGVEQKPIMPDIGVLYSDDIVAIDKASLDLANKYSEGKFSDINNLDNDKQIELVEALELGNSKYELTACNLLSLL